MSTEPRRGIAVWIAIGLAVAAIALVVPRGGGGGAPFDPTSTSEHGAKALVELLESFGAQVQPVAGVPRDADVALVLRDRFGDGVDDLDAWVRAGGVLVVADPNSSLVPPVVVDDQRGRVARNECDVPALARVEDLDVSARVRYRVPVGARRCHTSGATAFIVTQARGAGTLVSVGSPFPFVNDELGAADNSVLAVSLLAPRPGTRVAFIVGPAPGRGTKSIRELLPGNVTFALVQLALAFVVYALWRARRLGRPVVERAPVQIESSELVLAVGNLLARTRSPDAAAARLRYDTRRALAPRLGLAPDADAHAIAVAVAARTGRDAPHIERTLTDVPLPDEAALVTLGAELDAIRKEVLR